MGQPLNGHAAGSGPGAGWDAGVIAGYLAGLAARMPGLYDVRVVAAGPGVPYARVSSRAEPGLCEDVLVDFATDPPGYLTAFGHRLGDAGDPAAAAAALARLLAGGPEPR